MLRHIIYTEILILYKCLFSFFIHKYVFYIIRGTKGFVRATPELFVYNSFNYFIYKLLKVIHNLKSINRKMSKILKQMEYI